MKGVKQAEVTLDIVREYLEERVAVLSGRGTDPDEASWAFHVGILITANEAKFILDHLPHPDHDKTQNAVD